MKRTEISQLGKVAFIEQLTTPFTTNAQSTIRQGIGDDAAVIDRGESLELLSQATMLEGIDFDLRYTPLQHLGYKSVVAALSNITAMNGRGRYITLSIGLSARFSVEEAESLYEGVQHACKLYHLELIGGNTSASMTGLSIAVTIVGEVAPEKITMRKGAQNGDLICVSGNLGAAYMGLQLLEREKRALEGNNISKAELEGHNYILERQLRPQARVDILEELHKANLVPTSMTDITRGLASALLHLCHRSDVGARIYLDRIPIASQTFSMAEELHIDPVVAALNGGDDFELLFTAPIEHHKELLTLPGLDVIGHVVGAEMGAALITPDGSEIRVQAPDWTSIA